MSRLSFAAAVLFAAPLLAHTLIAQPSPATQPPKSTITAPPVGFTKSIVLWPDGAPGAHGTTEGDVPKLFTYPAQGAGPHASVIVMPGGGYTHLVMEMEGAYEARWLAMHGINAFVLEYRLSPAYVYPTQMLDGSRAIRYVRSHAAELGVKPDQIGIWGFSAGGHLAGYMATIHKAGDPNATDPIDRVSDRPDFAIISYGGLSMDVTTRAGGVPMQSILGPHPTQAVVDSIDPVKHVSADTSPSFIYSTTGDKTVDSHNASEFYGALKAAGVPAELHIFEVGPHGTHMGENLAPALHELTITPVLLANWLQLHGWMSAEAQYN
jgi:acetyl esterase/lipase